MTTEMTSRRLFVQLGGGLALALRHGLLAASTRESVGQPVAMLDDAAIRIEWDADMQARVSRIAGRDSVPLTSWGPSDYLLGADGRHLTHFALHTQSRAAVDDANGPGTRLTLSGASAEGIEKAVTVTLYRRFPGMAVYRVAYRNASAATVSVRGWTNGDFVVRDSDATPHGFWCYSGATYENRRDWILPVKRGFTQDNFLGMEHPDYGGGTPIVDVWRRNGGLAVGHVETTPKLVSVPVQERSDGVRVALCSRDRHDLHAGDSLSTHETFLAVHLGDHFAPLSAYRRFMSERGLTPAAPRASSYESIWCAWGYERDCTTELIEATLPKVQDLGLQWAVIDDGWQAKIGDWTPHPAKYPNGEGDLRRLVANIRAHGLKPRLWYSPLSVAPGSDELHDHSDMLLLDKNGAPQPITWWNSFYLCPAYDKTVQYTQALIQKFIGDWGFAGLKVDGQHLNGVPPCYNPAHHHVRPTDSVEGLQTFLGAIYQTATAINPDVVIELCPCGTSYSAFNFPYMNQAPASDPESSWQVRLKGKTLKALMGPSAPFAGDHVELSDRHDDFASTVGVGGIVSTKFTWPVDPKPKDSFLLTPEKERLWRRWIALYNEKMLPLGTYRGELYDICFDKPETHAIEKSGRMYYALFATRWDGEVPLRGLTPGSYRIRDYFSDRALGTVAGASHRLHVAFDRFLLLEAVPA